MALDPKLLLGGAILGFFLLKKPTKSNAASSTDGKDKNEDGKGDLNDPAGPNGCKTGLKEVNGICVDDPDLDENGNSVKNGGGTGNGKLAASDLYISKDCKSFAFGDKTGDAWWKAKGNKTAQAWIDSTAKDDPLDPYSIAFQMLKKTGKCYQDFPLREDFQNWYEYNLAWLNWIKKFPAPWTLLVLVKNKIDINKFNGMETITADPTKTNYGLVFGKQFNEEEFFAQIKPMILTMIQIEASTPGALLGIKEYANTSDILTNIATYMFWILMPNIPLNDLIVKYKKGMLDAIPFWHKLVDFTGEFEGQSIDLENEQF